MLVVCCQHELRLGVGAMEVQGKVFHRSSPPASWHAQFVACNLCSSMDMHVTCESFTLAIGKEISTPLTLDSHPLGHSLQPCVVSVIPSKVPP